MRIFGRLEGFDWDMFKPLGNVDSPWNGYLVNLSELNVLPNVGDIIDLDSFVNKEKHFADERSAKRWNANDIDEAVIEHRMFARDRFGSYVILEMKFRD